jgi:hypothetical protein
MVGLLADFVSHRDAAAKKDYDAFLEWLSEHRHGEVVKLLQQNANTATGIKILLQENQAVLLVMLDEIDRRIAALTLDVKGLSQVAESMRPDAMLSTEAINLLRDFDRTGVSTMMEVDLSGPEGRHLAVIDGPSNASLDARWRFYHDDMKALVSYGLLIAGRNSRGHRTFTFTRRAAEFVRSLPVAEAGELTERAGRRGGGESEVS